MRPTSRGMFAAVFFAIPFVCCLIGAGAFVHLALSIEKADQEREMRLREQMAQSAQAHHQAEQQKLREALDHETAVAQETGKEVERWQQRAGDIEHELEDQSRKPTEDSAMHAVMGQIEGNLAALRKKLAALDGQVGDKDADTRKLETVQSEIADLEARKRALAQQIQEARQEQARLKAERDKAERAQAEASKPKPGVFDVVGLGGGTERNRPAAFVECKGDGVLLQPAGKRLGASPGAGDRSEFLSCASSAGYVVFLVRPDGFQSFRRYRNLVLARNHEAGGSIDIGYEPVDADWTLIYPSQKG
jgi:AraC-like DNA-binding protein